MAEFETVNEYLVALSGDRSLAAISLQMAADALSVTRSSIERQVKINQLQGITVAKNRLVSAQSVQKKIEDEEFLLHKIRKYLERYAAVQTVVPYSMIMEEFGMTYHSPPDRKRMGMLLGKVSRQTYKEDGILLSAMVVKKGTTLPSTGFYELADELDLDLYNDAETDEAFGSEEIDRVFEHYM